jgi:hypothetical protein
MDADSTDDLLSCAATPRTHAWSTTPSPAIRPSSIHCLSHALQLWLLDLLPARLSTTIVSSMHHAIRKAGMKKEAKKRAESKAD